MVEAAGIGLFTGWVTVDLLNVFNAGNLAAAFGTTIFGLGVVAFAHWLLGRALRSGAPPQARWRVLLYVILALQSCLVPLSGVVAADGEETLGLRAISAITAASGLVVVVAAFALLVAMALRDRRSAANA
jgi:hypothetical protein